MTTSQKAFLLLILTMLLLPACGDTTPTLGIAGQPALVFIYTEG